MSLTRGCLASIFAGEKVVTPNLQILGYKKITGSGQERYRILLSDGEFSNSFGMLATKLNPMVHSKQLEQFTIINLKDYNINQVSPSKSVIMNTSTASQVQGKTNKSVVICTDISVVKYGYQVKEKIGNPVPLGVDGQVYSGFNVGKEQGGVQDASNSQRVGKEQDMLEDHTNQVSSKLENVRANVRNQYIGEIDKINENIKIEEQKLIRNASINEKEIKDLKDKQEWEKYALKRKFEQETESMNERHGEEMSTLKTKFQKREDKSILENLKETRTQLTKDLNKLDNNENEPTLANSQRNLEAARGTLECPICMETMRPPTRIWMCPSSHLVCEPCKGRLNGAPCPTCRTEKVAQRAHMAEDFARAVFTELIE